MRHLVQKAWRQISQNAVSNPKRGTVAAILACILLQFGSTTSDAAILRPGGLSGSAFSKTCVDDISNKCEYFNDNTNHVSGVGITKTSAANLSSNSAHGTNKFSSPPGPSISASSKSGAFAIPSLKYYYLSESTSEVSLYYYFLISGPANTFVPTLVTASGVAKSLSTKFMIFYRVFGS